MMQGPSDEQYRHAVRRAFDLLWPDCAVEDHAAVQRIAGGRGAYVELLVFIPADMAAREGEEADAVRQRA